MTKFIALGVFATSVITFATVTMGVPHEVVAVPIGVGMTMAFTFYKILSS